MSFDRWAARVFHGRLIAAPALHEGAFPVMRVSDHERILAEAQEHIEVLRRKKSDLHVAMHDTQIAWSARVRELQSMAVDPEWATELNEHAKTLLEALDGGPAGRPWWVDAGVSYSKLQGLIR